MWAVLSCCVERQSSLYCENPQPKPQKHGFRPRVNVYETSYVDEFFVSEGDNDQNILKIKNKTLSFDV